MKAGMHNYLRHVSEEAGEQKGETWDIIFFRGNNSQNIRFHPIGKGIPPSVDWVTLVSLPWTCIEPGG